MKTHVPLAVVAFVYFAVTARSAVRYVSLNSANPVIPYVDWSTAATNIQDAIDAANPGDQILVSNGVYRIGGRVAPPNLLTNRVVIPISVSVQSVNGPGVTVIEGNPVPGSNAVRCVYIANGASLTGFTLTHGATRNNPADNISLEWSGAGVWCPSRTGPALSNCVLISNYSAYIGGASYGGSLYNCAITSNTAYYGGGSGNSILNNCVLAGNSASPGSGGGAYSCMMTNCVLFANSAAGTGGGAWSCQPALNCTIVSNSAGNSGGGVSSTILSNSIVYYNTAPNYSNFNAPDVTMNYCCTAPAIDTNPHNFTNAPLFVNLSGGNLRLQSNSPCINSGINTPVATAHDPDGNPRIAGGLVDVGAYEYPAPASILPYVWLLQYGLALDGSADFADPDGDGMNNQLEWLAGTNPTNAQSVLKMVTVTKSTNGVQPGLFVFWVGGVNRTYFLQRSTNLTMQPAFTTIYSNYESQISNGNMVVTNTILDTTATNGGPYFYRIGVQ